MKSTNLAKDRRLRKTYGIGLDTYDLILLKQDKKCAICRRKLKLKGKPNYLTPQVDHCHETRKVRGILCRTCNFRIVPVFERELSRIHNLYVYLTCNKDYRHG